MRLIDADALKDKLQQHHDFYVMAWGGFSKMPIDDKKRVDEITNCIAEVVNAPTIEPRPKGRWILVTKPSYTFEGYRCSKCTELVYGKTNYCSNCGAEMSDYYCGD